MRKFSETSVRLQARSGRLCVINKGKVYDVTDFGNKHPGGRELLQEHAGLDVTHVMTSHDYHKHSSAATDILNQYYIGELESESRNNNKTDLVDMNQPLVEQIPVLGDKYFEWVHRPTDKHIRLFKSDLAEFFTESYWWLVPVYWVPIMFILLHWCVSNLQTEPVVWMGFINGGMTVTPSALPILFIMGIVLWTLAEYIIHRWIFHLHPPTSWPSLMKLHFMLHGQHHKAPMDKYRLVFPPLPASILALMIYGSFAIFWPKAVCQGLFAGTILGYIFYDLTHYYLHHGTPGFGYFRSLKKYHVKHHFHDQQKGFGISSKLWDYPFGTLISDD
ncbi:hypothetical protein ACJMK2_009414 [Sinanodonta woodiana]|uniref:Fatty acid 2-hydroxylase n=1 Tax=Sinanodonta woodiana TaxID=1069815 RepID=A0ABD3VCG7_SINWO